MKMDPDQDQIDFFVPIPKISGKFIQNFWKKISLQTNKQTIHDKNITSSAEVINPYLTFGMESYAVQHWGCTSSAHSQDKKGKGRPVGN